MVQGTWPGIFCFIFGGKWPGIEFVCPVSAQFIQLECARSKKISTKNFLSFLLKTYCRSFISCCTPNITTRGWTLQRQKRDTWWTARRLWFDAPMTAIVVHFFIGCLIHWFVVSSFSLWLILKNWHFLVSMLVRLFHSIIAAYIIK